MISTPLRMEKPVRSPMVPPIIPSQPIKVNLISNSIKSNVAVSKKMFTILRGPSISRSVMIKMIRF